MNHQIQHIILEFKTRLLYTVKPESHYQWAKEQLQRTNFSDPINFNSQSLLTCSSVTRSQKNILYIHFLFLQLEVKRVGKIRL